MASRFSTLSCLMLISFSFLACKQEKDTLFELLDSDKTGIEFSNSIFESDTLNIIKEEYIYNGGGVGVGDFNNDGLPDLYFSGNMVSNKLYLNEGNFKFEDITTSAGVDGKGSWCSGVTLVDITHDGLLDIYLGATLKKDSLSRKNLLYENQGLDKNGKPFFKEKAKEYGIADMGHTTHSAFFDYDKDGDLDLYVLTDVLEEKIPTMFRARILDGSALNNDRLYRNNGDGTFTNVTKEAGILSEGYGLGIAISDINLDGWPDIYVTNDYMSNDLLYINNGDGTFTDRITDYIKHTCFSAMGNDVVDMNNDGFVDIIALDMLPEANERKKMMIRDNNYITYINNEKYGYMYQYVRNVLQLNRGITPKGHPVFSEIGQMAGIYQTDWSWAPLVADYDNDGLRDMIITNGFPRDITDRDFAIYRAGHVSNLISSIDLVDSIPEVKLPNYGFKNIGNMKFVDNTIKWGLNIPTFSNGGAYSDLDNDGDLDLIVNNINDKASVYKNTLNDGKDRSNNYLRVSFKGEGMNKKAFGTKLRVFFDRKMQFYEQSPYRGYISSVEDIAHFGLGKAKLVDSLEIFWPDGKYQVLKNIKPNQNLIVDQSTAKFRRKYYIPDTISNPTFKEVSSAVGIKFKHSEEDKIDFNIQRTLPHKFSQMGPGISVGDIDNNGLDDFYIGGAARKHGTFFLQIRSGQFVQDTTRIQIEKVKLQEDMGSLFFDADNDNDLDLYVVSGSYEFAPDSPLLTDRFYKNDGKGRFRKDSTAIPATSISGSCVRAADFDKDGDLDLFIGGRVVNGMYPASPQSVLLVNEGGKFTDKTESISPGLRRVGMVSDALWSDFDSDGAVDLIIAGEWMPITFFKNQNGILKNVTAQAGLSDEIGWWNSLSSGDFDNDGDIDYIGGNLGINTNYVASKEQPLVVYGKDFDNSGRFKAVLFCYMKDASGRMKAFPMHTRDDLFVEMTNIKKKFTRFSQFSVASINEVLTEDERKGALVLKATNFRSSYIENLGNGKFRVKSLPDEAQYAPINGMITEDFNADGNLDLLIAGNDYSTEVFTGRYDAMVGLYLKGDGKGGFRPETVAESGFFVDGDSKGMAQLFTSNRRLIVIGQNRDSLKVYSEVNNTNIFETVALNPFEYKVIISFKDGTKRIKEFFYGSGYLSQSSRRFYVKPEMESMEIFDFKGNKRVVNF